MAAGQAEQEQVNEDKERLRRRARVKQTKQNKKARVRLKQTSLTKAKKRVLQGCRLKTKVTTNKTKEAPDATGQDGNTSNNKNKRSTCCYGQAKQNK